MGQSTSKHRAETSAKTGVFAIHDERLLRFPERCLDLDSLRTLSIENCHLGSLPDELVKFGPTLKNLSLCGNSLKKLCDLRPFVKLDGMDISRNSFKVLPSEGWDALIMLTKLDISQNEIEVLPESLCHCPKLLILQASKNRIKVLPNSIGNLKQLTDLGMGENQLQSLPSSMGGLERLKRLNVEKNRITSIPVELLTGTPVEKILNDGNLCTLEEQPGFKQYNERRVKCIDKQMETGGKVALGL